MVLDFIVRNITVVLQIIMLIFWPIMLFSIKVILMLKNLNPNNAPEVHLYYSNTLPIVLKLN